MVTICEYGAEPNSGRVCTAAIQKAIDACARNGGGRVLVPAGTYVTGTLYLKSHVELHLEAGAVLKASPDLADYNPDDAYAQNYGVPREGWNAKHLILCIEQTDVALTGLGTIDGSGDAFYDFDPAHRIHGRYYGWRGGYMTTKDPVGLRPGQLICFIESDHIRAEDVTLTNATSWSCFLHGCEWVQIRGLKVRNPRDYVNTDGIDIDCCRNVTVSDCIIDTGDDAIAVRCAEARLKVKKPCEHITIANCVLASNSSVFRFGVGTGVIRHVRITNIAVTSGGTLFTFNTSYNGRGHARIDDLHIQGVSACDTGMLLNAPIEAGSVTRLSLSDIRAELRGGIIVQAANGSPVEDISFDRVDLTLADCPHYKDEKAVISIENASDVRLNRVRIRCDLASEGWEVPFHHAGCTDLTLSGCTFSL